MPPTTTLPYGEAPVWCFPAFEFSMYLLFALCLLHAVKKDIGKLSYLIGGLLFGLLLEYVNVNADMGYVYGGFAVMFGKAPLNIPLCVGVGWGIIIYTARLFTDGLRLPLWASVCLDALLALSIDASMDAVAYRLHMWTWNWQDSGLNSLTAEWFGIPYGNFSGWLYVVFYYSLFNRLLERWLTGNGKAVGIKQAVIPLLSVLLSQAGLWVTMVNIGGFLRQHGVTDGIRLLCTLLLLGAVVAINWRKRRTGFSSPPAVAWLVPLWFHFYFFAGLFTGGFYKETIWLLVAGTVSLLLGVGLHVRFGQSETSLSSPSYAQPAGGQA